MPSRDPQWKAYRVGVYAVFGLLCAVLFVQLVRSITSDLYGRRLAVTRVQTPTACLEDLERLYGQLAARAVQPAPGAVDSEVPAQERDRWARRWEHDVEVVRTQCGLDQAKEPTQEHLASALDGLIALQRELGRSESESAAEARQVKDSLAAARRELHLR